MGCDIHAFVEYADHPARKDPPSYRGWSGQLYFTRNYWLYGFMAGVRGGPPLYAPRGMPDRVSWDTWNRYTLRVVKPGQQPEEDECTPAQAEGWVGRGASEWVGEGQRRVTHPDWHTPSWLTAGELQEVYTRYRAEDPPGIPEVEAIMAAMNALNGSDAERSRMVFWFDN